MTGTGRCFDDSAVYTTIYPGVEPYLRIGTALSANRRTKTSSSGSAWTNLASESIENMLGSDLKANWVVAPSGATPAQIRQQALARIVETCAGSGAGRQR